MPAGATLFINNNAVKQGLAGGGLFINNDPRKQGLSGFTYYYVILEFFRHPSISGRTRFIDLRIFPPEGVNPEYSLEERAVFDTAVIEYGPRPAQYLGLEDDVKRVLRLRWKTLPPAEQAQLRNFFVARCGKYQKFTLRHPRTGDMSIVRFMHDAGEIDKFTAGLYRGEVELVAVPEIIE